MNITIDPLQAFYLTGAIFLLAIAIFVYPTLKYGPKDDDERSSKSHRHKSAKSR